MADLKAIQANARERLAKAKEVELPKARFGNTSINFSHKTQKQEQVDSSAAHREAVETVTPINDQEEIETSRMATIQKLDTLVHHEMPLVLRYSYQLTTVEYPLAKEIAQFLNVPVPYILKRIMNEFSILPVDYWDAPKSKRIGETITPNTSIHGADAQRWITRRDPLGIENKSRVFRPVVFNAFDRTAKTVLAELKEQHT